MVVFGSVSQNGKISISNRARANLVVSKGESGCSEGGTNSRRNAVCLDGRFGGWLGPAIYGAHIADDLFPDLAVSELSRGPGIYG